MGNLSVKVKCSLTVDCRSGVAKMRGANKNKGLFHALGLLAIALS